VRDPAIATSAKLGPLQPLSTIKPMEAAKVIQNPLPGIKMADPSELIHGMARIAAQAGLFGFRLLARQSSTLVGSSTSSKVQDRMERDTLWLDLPQ